MRVIIFTVKNHIYANKIVKELLALNSIRIVGIVESDLIYPNKKNLSSLGMYLKSSGLNYVMAQIVKILFFKFGSIAYSFLPFAKKDHLLFPYRILTKAKDIPILVEKNINSEEFITRLSKIKPDLFISVLFNQLFRNNILSMPRLGTINFHPALLPSYRGISPTFWVLANEEKQTGVTIHSITNTEIDKGEILAQREIKILSSDTENSLYWRCVNIGIPLLKSVLDKIAKDGRIDIKSKVIRTNSSYFSLPTKQAMSNFEKKGRKLFTIKELICEI